MKHLFVATLFIGVVLLAEPVAAIKAISTSKAMKQEALDSLVYSCVSTRPGKELNAKTLSEDIKSLVKSGKIDDVRTDISKDAQGRLVLTFIITPKPIIEEIRITGNSKLSDRKLRNTLTSEVRKQLDEECVAADR